MSHAQRGAAHRGGFAFLLAALAISFLLALPSVAFAGRPAPPPTGGTVAVNPSTVAMGATYTISGSGYKPSGVYAVKIATPSATQYLFAFTDGSGRFSITNNTWERGTFPVEVWQSGVRKPARLAATSVTVK